MKIDLSRFSGPCACGRKHELAVKWIVIEAQAAKHLNEVLEEYKRPVFLCDTNTKKAALNPMSGFFTEYEVLELTGDAIHADNTQVACVQKLLAPDADVLIAVGSGTIHDIARYVAHERSIPFISVPTAASVDGFVSTVAAMTWHGMKKTMPAASPLYVFADTDIFAQAPYRLTASGISDLMGKYTALLDWRVSHYVTGEYFCPQIHDLELEAVHQVEEALDDIKLKEKDAMEKLMYALLLSGIAMQMTGNSRPASGAEHHVAHFWEMEVLNNTLDALHGEKVSIGLILCLEYYEKLKEAIAGGRIKVKPPVELETEWLKQTFGKKGLYEGILEENGKNILETVSPKQLEKAIPVIRDCLEALPDAVQMKKKLSLAGCVTEMTQIGLREDLKEPTLRLCPYVRRRLTLLRLSKMLDFPV